MIQMKRMAESRSQGFRVYYHDKVDLLQLFLIASELPKAAVNSFAGLRRFFFYIPTRFTYFTTFVGDVCLVKMGIVKHHFFKTVVCQKKCVLHWTTITSLFNAFLRIVKIANTTGARRHQLIFLIPIELASS
jgi:hypothetical protein